MRIVAWATAALLGVTSTIGPSSAATLETGGVTDVRRAFHQALAACPLSHGFGCTDRATDGVLRPLRTEIASLPRGPAGPAAWLELAARLRGDRLPAVRAEQLGLREAIIALYREARVPVDASLRAEIDWEVKALPAAEAAAVADLVSSLLRAVRLAARATRDADLTSITADPIRALRLATRPGSALAAELARIDMGAMAAAGIEMAEAIARIDRGVLQVELDLPFIFVGGEGDTVHTETRLLLVDVSGNDTYTNNAGGGLVSIIGGSLAADLGDGNDRYVRDIGAQGWGSGAAGVLYDEGGTDSYSVTQFGQGASVGGVGVLYDAGQGDDSYLSPATADLSPIGTKAASLGGIGLLVDEGGSDVFHQDGLDGLIWGAAGGLGLLASLGPGDDAYRADSIEQDLLGIVDVFAGPVQVSAEANGVAILYEEEGDDSYTCGTRVRQGCQGAAGGGSLGLLWDLAGNDTYWMGDSVSIDLIAELVGDFSPLEHPIFPMGQGAGYGLAVPGTSPALGILRDEGGADRYTAARWAQGFGTFGGTGVLYDTGGSADVYQMAPPFIGMRGDGGDWLDGVLGGGLDR